MLEKSNPSWLLKTYFLDYLLLSQFIPKSSILFSWLWHTVTIVLSVVMLWCPLWLTV